MDFEKNYKSFTDDKILSLIQQAETLKPEALLALKKEINNRASLSDALVDRLHYQIEGKYVEMAQNYKSYFIKSISVFLTLFLSSFVLILVLNSFLFHLPFSLKIVYVIITTILLMLIFRKSKPVATVKSETLEFEKYNKILQTNTVHEINLLEIIYYVLSIVFRFSKTKEIQYSDIICLDEKTNELEFYDTEMTIEQIFEDFEELFGKMPNASHLNKKERPKTVKKVILPLRYMENKKEFLKVLKIKNVCIK
ncbi:hypothetical protein [Flavobacterium sp.]|uniref:hypothetical protein n=1 Tax=Flavobacterium sp. TaxID=239 RepID=UPI004047F772